MPEITYTAVRCATAVRYAAQHAIALIGLDRNDGSTGR